MEKVPCTGNILVHFKNLPRAWVQQVWGQAADIVKHKHPALHCVVRAEVLQLRLHLPSAPFGIPVLYWDQHWDLWFVLHSSGFQHLLTTGLIFGSGHGNPREAKILAHKRGKHLCSAFTYQQNAQPRLDRATHSEGTETLLNHSTYVVKGHDPLERCFTKLFQSIRGNFIRKQNVLDCEWPFHWCAGFTPLPSPLISPSAASQRVFLYKLACDTHLAVQ